MKPILLILAFLALTFAAFSQRVNYPTAPSSVYAPYQQNSSNHLKSLLWSNDASNMSDWSFTNTSSPTKDWSVETDPELISVSGPFQSPSASNGYLVFVSDTSQGAVADAYVNYVGAQIDLTGETNIRIQFEQQYISDSNERVLEVSADGLSWFPFVISDGTSPTGAKEDDLASIDISSAAANASDLQFRFHFSGTQEGYWAIDDISLCSIDSVDLRAVGVDWGTIGAWGVRMPYYSVIWSQIQPIEFCPNIANDGLVNLDTVVYSISEQGAGFSSSVSSSIQADEVEAVCATQMFTPDPNYLYHTFDQSVTTNQLENNVLNNELEDIELTLDIGWSANYARDDIFSAGSGEIDCSNFVEYEVGNVFDFFDGECMTDVGFMVSPNATAGSEITGKLYRFDTVANDFILEDQTFTYVLTSGDIGTFVWFSLVGGSSSSYCELENTSYLVTIHTYGEVLVNYSNVVQTSGKSKPNTSFLIDWTNNPNGDWRYLTETPMVRLLTYPHGLIEYQSNFNFNISPNPSNQSTSLTFDLPSSSAVSFEIIDLSGKTVNNIEPNLFSEGMSELQLNTSDLVNGVYFVKFNSDFGSTTKRIVVQH